MIRQTGEGAWGRMIQDRKNQLWLHPISLTLLWEKNHLGSRGVEGWFPVRSTGRWKRNRGKLSYNHRARGRILQNVWLGKESPGANCSQVQTRPTEEWEGGFQGDASGSSRALSASNSRLLQGAQIKLTLSSLWIQCPSLVSLLVPSPGFTHVTVISICWTPAHPLRPISDDSFSTGWHSSKCSLLFPAGMPWLLGWKQNKNKKENNVRIWEGQILDWQLFFY